LCGVGYLLQFRDNQDRRIVADIERVMAMLPKPSANLTPNTLAFEMMPLVKPTGFREYDARWWFGHPGSTVPPELNLMGVQALGMGLGTLIYDLGRKHNIV